ncbi:uncharacterized protein PV09_06976 [Verruconis gallopava]|uniref:SH3 domain-containing protein n=1 Tax=Verruconis gallopava TaxID=253628 RepID=A0A0D1XH24_9PEZI|nr:uncharacterized protein PV09_06976 [Verruconis gallopava]KIW01496.1 hypothetical protein PV09_06976 [Verruconis gallopava]
MAAPQSLPTRFPCWCKAIYSWGGETKRDLGFMEGDLIECLNAGDGSWWMGRLRRDRRMVGLFPSNFVEVMPEGWSPVPSGSSPMPSRQNSANNGNGTPQQTPQKQKSTFRKPFQAYYKASSPNPEAAKRELERAGSRLESNSPAGSLRKTHRPYSSMKRPSNESSNSGSPSPGTPIQQRNNSFRAISPSPRQHPQNHYSHSRVVSPSLNASHPTSSSHYHPQYRATSPAPVHQYHSHSRAVSPNPYQHHTRETSLNIYQEYDSHRATSPNPEWDQQHAPPPPPPTHRYINSRAPSPQHYTNGYHTPDPTSPAVGHTPSPIANAMNDVMDCLGDMTIARDPSPEPPREATSIWSPEAFDELYANNGRKQQRPHTSIEHRTNNGYEGQNGEMLKHSDSFRSNTSNEPSNVGDYVQRMEQRLRLLHEQDGTQPGHTYMNHETDDASPPEPPPKSPGYDSRPKSSLSIRSGKGSRRGLRHVKSGYEIGKQAMNRTFTLKSTSTTVTNSSSSTNHTLMSGTSAGGFSATSAGSYYRRKWSRSGDKRPTSVLDVRSGASSAFVSRPSTPMTGITYHSSHASNAEGPDAPASIAPPPGFYQDGTSENVGVLGGLSTPRAKKSGFFKKMIETAKTGAATARSTISTSRPGSPVKMAGFAGGIAANASSSRPQSVAAAQRPQSAHASIARDMGLGGGSDWVQVRRDVNRSNSVSKNERIERAERCQMLDMVVMQPTDELYAVAEGDEGLDGLPITEPTDFAGCNFQLVDKSARFVNNVPGATTVAGLVQGYLCRPYRSDVQRLRAIFTWTSERICWEEDFEIGEGDFIDTRRVISQHRGCSQKIAYLVAEMCSAVGIHAEIVRGYLKTPGEPIDFENVTRPNHWWNAVIIDGEWRIMDTALANPTHSRRKFYSTTSSNISETWYFLARPMEICYTHVPLLPEQQHIVPSIATEILMALPTACPTYFQNRLEMVDYCTSLLHLDNLEMAQVHISVPEDVECVAETEVRAFAKDEDGDFFESGDTVSKPALSQAEWIAGRKRFTIKALLPGDEGQGVLKIYAGKRGLMHSIKSNPHSLALALPLTHTGSNPPYSFFVRHPTPHAQKHDLYVIQPQCMRLVVNNTFIFSVRQHPSSLKLSCPTLGGSTSGVTFSNLSGRISPTPLQRPPSAMSMASVSQSGSNYSIGSNNSSNPSSSGSSSGDSKKPAKLAIQSPSGKIIRLTRKSEHMMTSSTKEPREGTEWETVIKVGERGIWRGLVLADRSARWCVFAEWECV